MAVLDGDFFFFYQRVWRDERRLWGPPGDGLGLDAEAGRQLLALQVLLQNQLSSAPPAPPAPPARHLPALVQQIRTSVPEPWRGGGGALRLRQRSGR